MASKSSPLSTFQHFDTWGQEVMLARCWAAAAALQLCEAYCLLPSHRFGQPCRCYGPRFHAAANWQQPSRLDLAKRPHLRRELSPAFLECPRAIIGPEFLAIIRSIAHFYRFAQLVFGAPHCVCYCDFRHFKRFREAVDIPAVQPHRWRGRHGAYELLEAWTSSTTKRRRPGGPGDAPRPSLASHTITKNSNAGTA